MRYLLITFTLISCLNFSGKEPEKLRLFKFEDSYDWRDCLKPSEDYIKKQIPVIKKHFSEYLANTDGFGSFLHFIDFNNDYQLDVIYSGNSGAEGDYVVFLLNTGNDYTVLFQEYTHIAELNFDDKILVGYIGLYFGCCAEYVSKVTKYSISGEWKKTVVYQRAITDYTEHPRYLMMKPEKFVVDNETHKLRSSPVIDDTSVFIYDTISNVVSTYRKGAIGNAWSETKHSTGRIWWFVEMEPTDKQIGTRLNSKYDTVPVSNLGWISSRYLKEIK